MLGQNAGAKGMLKLMFLFFFPRLFKLFKLAFVPPETMEFFANIIRNSIKTRKDQKVKMNDFIDFWLDMEKSAEKRQQQKLDNDENEQDYDKDAQLGQHHSKVANTTMNEQELERMIISSGLLVFFAGNDTTTTALSLVFYFMARHPDLQEKMYQEIKVSLDRN